jgi:hypothetical protein
MLDALHKCGSYWLLVLGDVERGVPSTATLLWLTVSPYPSSNTPDSSTSALWLHHRDIYQWLKDVATNVLEFCWRNISILLRNVL